MSQLTALNILNFEFMFGVLVLGAAWGDKHEDIQRIRDRFSKSPYLQIVFSLLFTLGIITLVWEKWGNVYSDINIVMNAKNSNVKVSSGMMWWLISAAYIPTNLEIIWIIVRSKVQKFKIVSLVNKFTMIVAMIINIIALAIVVGMPLLGKTPPVCNLKETIIWCLKKGMLGVICIEVYCFILFVLSKLPTRNKPKKIKMINLESFSLSKS